MILLTTYFYYTVLTHTQIMHNQDYYVYNTDPPGDGLVRDLEDLTTQLTDPFFQDFIPNNAATGYSPSGVDKFSPARNSKRS